MIYGIIVIAIALILFHLWYSSVQEIEDKIKAGFPDEWDKLLKKNVGIYHVLNDEQKKRFQERVHRFILTKPIVGFQTEVDDLIKLLVAASAVMLTLSFKQWSFNYLSSVLIVDGALNDNLEEGIVMGQVQTEGDGSKMVLSKSALLQGFKNMADRKNVGIHEFAHVLDHVDGEIDGIPKTIMPPDLIDAWVKLMGSEIRKINKNESDINDYGATNESEFFAVVTEYFFEKPDIMKAKHPKMYDILSKTFQQDISSTFKVNFKNLMGIGKDKAGRNDPCPCGSGKKFKKCCLRT